MPTPAPLSGTAARSDLGARLRRIGAGCALATLGTIAVTVVGFVTTNLRLLAWVDGAPPIRANVALGMALLAGSVLLGIAGGARSRRAALFLSAVATLIGAATLLEFAGVDLHIDRLLFDPPPGLPARPALNSAAMLVILGVATSLMPRSRSDARTRGVVHALAVSAAIVGLLGLIGYTSGETGLYTLGSGRGWALPSVLGDFLIALALLALQSDVGVMRILTSAGPGGRIARVLFPVGIAVAIVGQAINEAGRSLGVFSTSFGDWLVTVGMCVLLGGAVLVVARRIETVDRERVAFEAALRLSEERYRGLFEGARDAIFAADLLGNLTSVNAAAEQTVGFERVELLHMNFFDLIAPAKRDEMHVKLRQALAGDESTVEVPLIAKDGHEVLVEVTGRVVEESGRPVRIEGIARDLTERRALESKYLQAQKMETVGRLAGGIAHDFNNLLTAIFGYTDLALLQVGAEEEELRNDVEQVRTVAERGRDLAKQLLAFSRQQALAPRPLSLGAVIEDSLPLVERLLPETIEVVYRAGDGVGYCIADPASLDQVLLNLVVNSRDAMPAGGTIAIVTGALTLDAGRALELGCAPGDYLTVAVADTGTGIDPGILDKLFEPFFTTKAVGEGTGLGLSTVHGIVHQLGGAISVENVPGGGAAFTAYLRACRAPADANADGRSDSGPASDGAGRTVLLVEDEAVVRKLLELTMSRHGYDVITASSPGEALVLAARHPFDVLVTDVVMPGRTGISLAAELRAARAGLPVVFLSGYSPEIAHDHGLVEGVSSRFLQKPFSTDELLQALAGLKAA